MKLKLTPEEYSDYCAEYNAWLDNIRTSEQLLNLKAVIDAQPERQDNIFEYVTVNISTLENP